MKKIKLLSMLNYWLKYKELLFTDHKEFIVGDGEKRRIFIDRGSDILFVAHIDTVQTPVLKKHHKSRIWAAGLDDRLGCGLASELSRFMDVDLLICDLEESAKSSGQYHDLKDYNWIAEFDRSGDDVVTYDMDDDDFLTALHKHFTLGWGTFSDLCLLNTKSCCVNIGIGYHHAHSEDSYVDINQLNIQLDRFRKFFYEFKDTKFTQDEDKMRNNLYLNSQYYGSTPGYRRDDWSNQRDVYDTSEFRECEYCGHLGAEDVFNYKICESCFEEMSNAYLYTTWNK